ncbi:MAG TPA: hypothetical protein VF556_07935 [Pyrinomonadaceae bacterium]|jgi:hypothetical protein
MNQVPFETNGSLSHRGRQAESSKEVLRIRQRWIENDSTTFDEMQTGCCYALHDKTWVTAPGGNRWKVFVVPENTEKDNIFASSCCAPTAKMVSISR